MNDLAKLLAIVGTAVVIKKIIDSRRACLYAGPFKLCNY